MTCPLIFLAVITLKCGSGVGKYEIFPYDQWAEPERDFLPGLANVAFAVVNAPQRQNS